MLTPYMALQERFEEIGAGVGIGISGTELKVLIS